MYASVRVRFLLSCVDRGQFGAGAFDVGSRLKFPEDRQVVRTAVCCLFRRKRQRTPDVRPERKRKGPRRHADDGARLTVNANGPADDVRAATKAALPERFADHDLMVLSPDLIARLQRAAEDRRDAERLEKVRRDEVSLHALGTIAAGEVDIPPHGRRHTSERGDLLPPLEKIRGRDGS